MEKYVCYVTELRFLAVNVIFHVIRYFTSTVDQRYATSPNRSQRQVIASSWKTNIVHQNFLTIFWQTTSFFSFLPTQPWSVKAAFVTCITVCMTVWMIKKKKLFLRVLRQPHLLPVTEDKKKSPSLFISVIPQGGHCFIGHLFLTVGIKPLLPLSQSQLWTDCRHSTAYWMAEADDQWPCCIFGELKLTLYISFFFFYSGIWPFHTV